MNNKELLQQELKEKIKKGISPSDLKKQKRITSNNNSISNIPNPPPFSNLASNQQDLLKKIKELEANNNLLTKTIQGLQNKQENKVIDKGEKKEFACYHCKKIHDLSLLVLELPKGKLCQGCWQILREKTKDNIKSNKFTCYNCQENKEGKEYKVKLDTSLKEWLICPSCLPLIKEYNEAENKSERELEIWE